MKIYIKLPIALLDVPIQSDTFKQVDMDDVVTYLSIREYVKRTNHTVSNFSTDGYFIKGFGADLLEEVHAYLDGSGMDFTLMNIGEVHEEMKKSQWRVAETI